MLDHRVIQGSNGFAQTATFSLDGQYRYALTRDWNSSGKITVFILLNPSTGNEETLERTTTGCMVRAQKWGYAGMIVLNLFNYITTYPQELKTITDPIGEYGNEIFSVFFKEIRQEDVQYDIIAAWGIDGKYKNRAKEVVEKFLSEENLYCLGVNQDGSPKHPLHLSYSVTPQLWRGAGENYLN